MRPRIKSCAYRHSNDIPLNVHLDAKDLDRHLAACVGQATRALEKEIKGYSEFQRYQLAEVLRSMERTHATIRGLIGFAGVHPSSVDALALARTQLEGLYAICFMLEKPEHVDRYVRDDWAKDYRRLLLEREEYKGLPRFQDELQTRRPKKLRELQAFLGISEAERQTIDERELGSRLPLGAARKEIARFPTPARVLKAIQSNSGRKRMLERLYFEYEHLSRFVHGLPAANILKTVLDEKSPYRLLVSQEQRQDFFQREIAERGVTYSYLSVIQAAAEFLTVYADNADFVAVVREACKLFSENHLLCRAIWEIRTKELVDMPVK